jgi:hypothetical protein
LRLLRRGRRTINVDYGISLAGLPIGTADLASTVEGSQYKLQVQAKMTGLVGAMTSGKGGANASGAMAGGRPLPSVFMVTSRSGKEMRHVRIGMAGGNVTGVDIVPPLEPREDRVPLSDAHKRGVLDPVSALVLVAPGNGGMTDPGHCNRTIPVFDGTARFNIVLSYAETRSVEKAGYRGPVLVCNIRYVPIAGHRAERPAIKFMEENRDMQVWLAPVEGSRLLVPLRIAVRTMIGMSVVEASRWSLGGGEPVGRRAARN